MYNYPSIRLLFDSSRKISARQYLGGLALLLFCFTVYDYDFLAKILESFFPSNRNADYLFDEEIIWFDNILFYISYIIYPYLFIISFGSLILTYKRSRSIGISNTSSCILGIGMYLAISSIRLISHFIKNSNGGTSEFLETHNSPKYIILTALFLILIGAIIIFLLSRRGPNDHNILENRRLDGTLKVSFNFFEAYFYTFILLLILSFFVHFLERDIPYFIFASVYVLFVVYFFFSLLTQKLRDAGRLPLISYALFFVYVVGHTVYIACKQQLIPVPFSLYNIGSFMIILVNIIAFWIILLPTQVEEQTT